MTPKEIFEEKIEACDVEYRIGFGKLVSCPFAIDQTCTKVNKKMKDLTACPPNKRTRKNNKNMPEQIDWVGHK